MQKTNLRASILIWSIFLSLMVSLSFVIISAKVNQNIRLNNFMEEFLNKDDKLNDLVNSTLEWDISDNETLTKIDNLYTINNKENLVLSFSWKTDFTWSIKLKSWWPLYYEIFSFSWASTNLTNDYSTWILSDSTIKNFTWYLNTSYDRAELTLKNLWWYSTFVFESSLETMWTWTSKKFTITRNIWWMDIEKTIIEN